MREKVLLIVVFLIGFFGVNAQEIVTGLQYNEAIRHELKKNVEQGTLKNTRANQPALQLPFFDDFSQYSYYPDEAKWIGKSVYVNKDFPQYPTNVGAATFDALDASGKVYEDASWIPFMADAMTSQVIRLDSLFDPVTRALGPQDSIYLSFYYQPQGNGNEPESWDTLILDFAYLGDTVFSHIDSTTWSTQYWLTDLDDTIPPLTRLYNPSGMGCNEDLFVTTYAPLTWTDSVTIPCDSVFGPDTLWQKVWHAEGLSLSDFKSTYGSDFVQVMIPIYTDTNDLKFFTSTFQFRFRNYASISNDIIPSWRSNVDQWNVDWVYLNYNRNAGDSTYRELTFSQRAPSFLKEYQSMPYRQYRAGSTVSLLKSSFEMYIANLDDVEHNTNYEYKVQQVNGDFNYSYYGGSCNLLPYDLFGFQNCNSSCGSAHACPFVNSAFNYDYSRDTTSYTIKHYISDSSETDIIVDSTIYVQGFYNYFAYDDGTPEFGYGVEPAGALVAYKFSMSVPDTLQGVQMYFNRTLDNANEIFFNLNVWNDNNGEPGEIIYSENSLKPLWENGLYEFYPYMFADTTIIVSGTFYVGWQQQAGGNLNIGLDSNNDNGDKIFFSNDNNWTPSDVAGSLMIRPIVGPDMVLDVEEKPAINTLETVKIYPNPAGNSFRVDQSEVRFSPGAEIRIYNIYGSLVYNQIGIDSEINISVLSKGMYIVKINDQNQMYSAKLLINR